MNNIKFRVKGEKHYGLSLIHISNLYNLLLRPVTLRAGLTLEYPLFDGFMFYIANPMFLIWFAGVAKDVCEKKLDGVRLCIVTVSYTHLDVYKRQVYR